MRIAMVAALVCAWGAEPVSAQFTSRLLVSPFGSRYVVIDEDGPTFQLVERRGGVAPPKVVIRKTSIHSSHEVGEWVVIDRDPRDTLLGRGRLPYAPMDLRVLERSVGMVLVGNQRHGNRPWLSRVDARGRVLWKRTVVDFGGVPKKDDYWYANWWIDEALDVVVIRPHRRPPMAVDMKSGAIRACPASTWLAGMRLPFERDRLVALYSATRAAPPRGARALAAAMHRDRTLPRYERLLATMVVRAAGGPLDEGLLLECARSKTACRERGLALVALGRLLGPERALAFVRPRMAGASPRDRAWLYWTVGFWGERMIGPLCRLLDDRRATTDERLCAALILQAFPRARTLASTITASYEPGALGREASAAVVRTLKRCASQPDRAALPTLLAARQSATDRTEWTALFERAIAACERAK